jgi:hypothetical protein
MMDGGEQMAQDGNEFRGARVGIFGTDPGNPNEGRIFVWTKMGWFERLEGASGGVAFTPIAQSENELRELISRDDPSADLAQLGGEYKNMVSKEFMEQSSSYQNSPEYSHEDPLEEDSQKYHQHD